MDKIYYTYVLRSKRDNNIYIGITDNLERRLKQHNAGKNISTKHRVPFELIYTEKHDNRANAREREKFLKSGCGREWVKERYFAPIA